MAGGLDIETAYQLSDTYIQASERAQTVEEVSRLSFAAIIDFANRVAACNIPASPPNLIFRTCLKRNTA